MSNVRFIVFGNSSNRQRALLSLQNQTINIADNVVLSDTLDTCHYGIWSGWTVYLNDNDTVREDYVELLTTRYAEYDVVVPRMTDGKNVFPALGSFNSLTGCPQIFASKLNTCTWLSLSTLENCTITDEYLYYIGGVTVPRTLSELIIKTAKGGENLTLCELLRGGSGVSLFVYGVGVESFMSPCLEYWVCILTNANIRVTRITSLLDVVPGTTLLAYSNMLHDQQYVKRWPMIVMHTEPLLNKSKRYDTIFNDADLVLEYNMAGPGMFFPHMFYAQKYYVPITDSKQKNSALFAGDLSGYLWRQNTLESLKTVGIDVSIMVHKTHAEMICKLAYSQLAPLVPRQHDNVVEMHRLASIICAGTPVVAIYEQMKGNVPHIMLLSDVVTFTSNIPSFIKKCGELVNLNLYNVRTRNRTWWLKQNLNILLNNVLLKDYVPSGKYVLKYRGLNIVKNKQKVKAKMKVKMKVKKMKVKTMKVKTKATIKVKTMKVKTIKVKTMKVKTMKVKTPIKVKTMKVKTPIKVKTKAKMKVKTKVKTRFRPKIRNKK